MNTKEMTREQVSALADGELSGPELDNVLAKMRDEEKLAGWDAYHLIGDVLRCDNALQGLSPGFAARLAARLDAEPNIGAPSNLAVPVVASDQRFSIPVFSRLRKAPRWAMPGLAAAAAMASVAFVATPQLMVAMRSEPDPVPSSTMTATATAPDALRATEARAEVVAAKAPEGVVLRDPRIDDYLLAHQRFSPSVFSSAQYARSATFATDSGK